MTLWQVILIRLNYKKKEKENQEDQRMSDLTQLKTGILLIHEIASTLLMLFGCTQYSEVNDSGGLGI